MVWGMGLPSTFGQFFPNGEYVGWEDELTAYFNNEMPADQKARFSDSSSYCYWAIENFVNEPGTRHGPDNQPFGPIAAHEAPKRFKTEKNYASLGALIETYNRVLAVSQQLKDVIERFEPGVHHFFPIEIEMPKKRTYPERYFILAIGQYIDSFSQEQSDPASWEHQWEEYGSFVNGKKPMAGLALSKVKFGDAHLWREHRMSNGLTCFSDALMRAIDQAGLRLRQHHRLKEI